MNWNKRLKNLSSLALAIVIVLTMGVGIIGLVQSRVDFTRTVQTMQQQEVAALYSEAYETITTMIVAVHQRQRYAHMQGIRRSGYRLSSVLHMTEQLHRILGNGIAGQAQEKRIADLIAAVFPPADEHDVFIFNSVDGHLVLPPAGTVQAKQLIRKYFEMARSGSATADRSTGVRFATIPATSSEDEFDGTEIDAAMGSYSPLEWVVCATTSTNRIVERQKVAVQTVRNDLVVSSGLRIRIVSSDWGFQPIATSSPTAVGGRRESMSLERYPQLVAQQNLFSAKSIALHSPANTVVDTSTAHDHAGTEGPIGLATYLPQWGWIVMADAKSDTIVSDRRSIDRLVKVAFGSPAQRSLLVLLLAVLIIAVSTVVYYLFTGSARSFQTTFRDSMLKQVPIDTRNLKYQELRDTAENFNKIVNELHKVGGSLKSAEEKFMQSQKMEAVGRLSGGIAHDFNNILGIIMGHADLGLADSSLGHEQRQHLLSIRDASMRASTLTHQLLVFSRRRDTNRIRINPSHLVTQIERMLNPILGKGIELQIDLDQTIGSILADEGQLVQAILNLVINACDAMPDGGVITVCTRRATTYDVRDSHTGHDFDANCVVVEVTDTGMGMAEETRARAFEPFFTTKGEGRGTGLGLATVQDIVTKNEGRIQVETEKGKGTSFRLLFPEYAPSRNNRTRKSDHSQCRATVLVAENDGPVRTMMVAGLREAGYCVLEADGGLKALELLQSSDAGEIDLLVCAVMMPDLTGDQLIQRIPEKHSNTAVLFVTAYAGLRDLGDSPILHKPFPLELLVTSVEQLLRQYARKYYADTKIASRE